MPAPPPAIAPLLPTVPGDFLERTFATFGKSSFGGTAGGKDFGASGSLAAEVAAAVSGGAAPAPAQSSSMGLKMLAAYESRAPAPA